VNEPSDPKRLLDGGAQTDVALQKALRLVSQEAPSSAQVQAIADHVAHALTSAAGAGGAGGLGSVAAKSVLLKLGGVLLLGSAALLWMEPWRATSGPVGGAVESGRERPTVSTPAPRAPTMPVVQAAPPLPAAPGLPVAPPVPAAPALPVHATKQVVPAADVVAQPLLSARSAIEKRAPRAVSDTASGAEASAASSVKARRAAGHSSALAAQGDAPSAPVRDAATASTAQESELELLAHAQRKLANNPSAALVLLHQHRERYAQGAFAEERDVLVLEALLQLGMMRELRGRARGFLDTYPSSAHRGRVRDLLLSAERASSP
jgi:hypothetical protein